MTPGDALGEKKKGGQREGDNWIYPLADDPMYACYASKCNHVTKETKRENKHAREISLSSRHIMRVL